VALLLLGIAIVVFLKRINTRNKLLLAAQNELMKATAEQKKLKEQQLKNELEHKESQLSALTLQMLQKNELMQELKSKLDESSTNNQDSSHCKKSLPKA
jgi:Co/Zn/Cd efflux system component